MNHNLAIVLGMTTTVVIMYNITNPFIIGVAIGLTTLGSYYIGRGDKR